LNFDPAIDPVVPARKPQTNNAGLTRQLVLFATRETSNIQMSHLGVRGIQVKFLQGFELYNKVGF
jgi:hypothetical protein